MKDVTNTEITFKENIKYLRNLYGFTYKEVAQKIDLDYAYYYRLEQLRFNSNPTWGTLEKISRFYNIPVNFLLINRSQWK